MTEESVKVPDDLQSKMDQFPDFDWNELIRKTIEDRVTILEKFDRITAKSDLTEQDAIEIGKKMNQDALTKYLKRRTR